MTFARVARPVVGFSFLRSSTIPVTVELSWKMPSTMQAMQKILFINVSKQFEWSKSDRWLKKLNVKMLSESFAMSLIFISLCLSAPPYFSQVVLPFLVLFMKLQPREAAAPCSGGRLCTLVWYLPSVSPSLQNCDLSVSKLKFYYFL